MWYLLAPKLIDSCGRLGTPQYQYRVPCHIEWALEKIKILLETLGKIGCHNTKAYSCTFLYTCTPHLQLPWYGLVVPTAPLSSLSLSFLLSSSHVPGCFYIHFFTLLFSLLSLSIISVGHQEEIWCLLNCRENVVALFIMRMSLN